MSNIIVAKFGGSSLADSGQFQKVKAIIRADERRRFVVPSAPGKRNKEDEKITDLLYKCHDYVKNNEPIDGVFDIIAERYMGIVKELPINFDIKAHLDIVRKRISEGASADYTASRGEYLNGLILASYLGFDFVDAKDVIFFNEDGQLDSEKTQEVMSAELSKVKNAVIPGFYGSLPNGEIKTFSRGGSDITGAIVARGIGADLYENWTDVSGFLMADPRIVDEPKIIEKITYKELRELAYMGATVLHEDSVFPVRQAKIPINIRNTNSPADAGTLIVSEIEKGDNKGAITGVAGKKNFTVITIEKNLMNSEIGFGRKLLEIFEKYNVSFEHMPSGIDTLCVIAADGQLNGNLKCILDEINCVCKPDNVYVQRDLALIATVGRGMASVRGTAAKLCTALAEDDINIRMIDQGSSEMNIIIGVESCDFEKSIRAIYNKFVK
ncbi:aspartokinase 3 [Oxobacter pfennigii]|uniref:Aspartokinase n=1 Tax=Oxobacter pfennigii TaxID=36849 RepID=A0A0P8W7U1_9CLOT|nr:aspartate kinase [Oxobacter pfennigii]KPU43830.1 aspartokinase 3 [Oxobacter pfennigii]